MLQFLYCVNLNLISLILYFYLAFVKRNSQPCFQENVYDIKFDGQETLAVCTLILTNLKISTLPYMRVA